MEKKNLNMEELEKVTGGNDGYCGSWRSVRASVVPGTFLALRSQPIYDDNNIIVEIQPGEIFNVNTDNWSGSYVWGSARGCEGWVNADYIIFL